MDKEWMSDSFKYYRETYFLWNRVNEQKASDIENLWLLEGEMMELKDKSEAQLSLYPRTEIKKDLIERIFNNAFLSHKMPSDYSHHYTYLLKYKNGKYDILYFTSDEKIFYNKTQNRYYKII